MNRRRRHALGLSVTALGILAPTLAVAAPGIQIDLGGTEPAQAGAALKIILLTTALSLAPAILLATTSFLRISVVFAFLRSALGVQGMPPNQVVTGLALFMTIAIMAPVGGRIYDDGLGPYLDGKLDAPVAWQRGSAPLAAFMLKQTREADLALFCELNAAPAPQNAADVKLQLLAPAFIISELRTAFEMGFLLFVPFLLVDLVVASVLTAMGMVMLPPALISMPVKVLLFVLADGWALLVGSLVRSFA
ncbi:MAG: flagellar type III secretion system pore protein FliP [Deltaproteobacteria bacterium]|nr:flagellar type III secretion system pore protein FliP [Deltaproteobacteria bacterium]